MFRFQGKCRYCKKIFSDLSLHLEQKCHLTNGYCCTECSVIYLTLTKFIDQSASELVEVKKCVKCNCDMERGWHDIRNKHQNMEYLYICQECDESYINKRDLKKHVKNTHPDVHAPQIGQKTKKCSHCGKSFVTHHRLKTHLYFVHGVVTSPENVTYINCTKCEKSFPSFCLSDHMFRAHKDKKKCMQKESGVKKFKIPQLSKVARKKGKPKISKIYVCQFCGVKLIGKNLGHIKRHEETHNPHRQSKPAQICHICGKSLASLRDHMRYAHRKGSKPISEEDRNARTCSVCGKVCVRKRYLICHMRTHTGEEPYSCPLCNKTFKTKSYYNKHVKSRQCENVID